jgi:hypothetical protein
MPNNFPHFPQSLTPGRYMKLRSYAVRTVFLSNRWAYWVSVCGRFNTRRLACPWKHWRWKYRWTHRGLKAVQTEGTLSLGYLLRLYFENFLQFTFFKNKMCQKLASYSSAGQENTYIARDSKKREGLPCCTSWRIVLVTFLHPINETQLISKT